MSSSIGPLKSRRLGERCTLNLSRAQTSSCWCGVLIKRGGASFLRINRIELTCSNLYSNEDIGLSEINCVESEKSADEIDNYLVNPDTYVARDGTE
ncbi:hypothetical protein TNCV_1626191 [Trichonephila clavipes]|nr:hypothetical protein TNCV_1626191 [Trichonephila clavipes]